MRRSRRDLKVAAGAVPGVHPLLLAPAPNLPNRVLGRPRQPQRGGVAEALSKRRQAEPHRVHEAAVAPARPRAAALGLQQDHAGLGLELCRRTTPSTSPCIRRPPRPGRRRALPPAAGAPRWARPPGATSPAPCAQWPRSLPSPRRCPSAVSEATRRRASRGARSAPAGRSEACRPVAAASSSRPSPGPRHWCCRPGSDPARRGARRGFSDPRPGRPARPGCTGCGASGRPTRCRPAPPPRPARTRRCGSARGSGRRSRPPRCSRETPATPGRSAQIPRTLSSTRTPACDAR